MSKKEEVDESFFLIQMTILHALEEKNRKK